MVAAVEPAPLSSLGALPMAATDGAAARAMARAYLRYASALWSGDATISPERFWLNNFWCADLPPAPPTAPDAVSPHGGGGRGICWYEVAGEVRGYVAGMRCGFRLPIDVIQPGPASQAPAPSRLRSAPAAEWVVVRDRAGAGERAGALGERGALPR